MQCCERELEAGGRPVVYTNRKVIRRQLSDRLSQYGVEHGVRASGVKPKYYEPVQVASIDTERVRSLNPEHPLELHESTLVIIDEAHSNTATAATEILDRHDVFTLGLTATPVNLATLYDELEILITNSEARKRGVIVPCDVFSPSEIDMDGVDLNADGEYVQSQMQGRFDNVKWAVLGSIIEHYNILNPLRTPTILFPPGVPESRWLAEDLTKNGIATEHIGAGTTEANRELIFGRFATGETKIITSYGVLIEGWDGPAEHAILCRPVASTSVYIQLVGRILRWREGKTHATLQEHVGAWHRPGLGSPNQDRDWKLTDTNKSIAKTQRDAFSKHPDEPGAEKEPVRCSKCSRPLTSRTDEDYTCVCGNRFVKSQRRVIQLDGTLEKKIGNATKRKPRKDDTFFYRSAIFMAIHSGKTVAQAYGYAMTLKRKHTGNPGDYISRQECSIYIPERTSEKWLRLAEEVYPWAKKK